MKIGIIGLPNTGKTTVFNALTGSDVQTASYASGAAEHHLGQVQVPDERLERLNEIYEPKKKVPAVVEFVDIAGITRGAGREESGHGRMLQFIRDVDALLHVVRVFEDETVPVDGDTVDPDRDIRAVDTEMILNDMVAVEARLERLERDMAHLPKDKRGPLAAEKEVLDLCRPHLEEEKPLRSLELPEDRERLIRGYAFLSRKPMMVLLNIGEGQLGEIAALADRHRPGDDVPTLAVCGKVEAEIAQLDADDAALFMSELGITESGLDRVIRTAYGLLGLQSFFTVGKDEVRAWTIRKGDDAVTAAGRIHSDLARGFIRAEVVSYDELIAAGSWNKAKEAARLRLEGKDYVVQDGDVLSIRFNI